ncbi:MAG: hypothetical protein IKV48_07025 [Eggerthellaceae bacterium]|nr:hypothetical protein [Eggerthellaceae bacterium]
MKVTKRADLLAKMKREEAERRAEREFGEYLQGDTAIQIAIDCFDALKMLTEVCLRNVPFDASIHVDAYDQLEILRVRLECQGERVEWREILPDYLKGTYGMEER